MTDITLDGRLQQTSERLQKINRDTATHFDACVVALRPRLSDAALTEFSALALAIAEAGWRSFECVELLFRLALQHQDTDRLLQIARYGEQFVGYSFEPAQRYFQFLLSASIPLQNINEIESGAILLQARYAHAASLLSGYFQSASHVSDLAAALSSDSAGDVSSLEGVSAWVSLSGRLLDTDRDSLLRFLKLSETHIRVDWAFIQKLGQVSVPSALAYLDWTERLRAVFSDVDLLLIEALMLRHAEAECDELLSALAAMNRVSSEARGLLLELGEQVGPVSVLVKLLSPELPLPLERPEVVRQWLQAGIASQNGAKASLDSHQKGLLAWVSLESAASINLLTQLKGQVGFADHARTFNLMAEALSASQIEIIVADDKPETANKFNRPDTYRQGGEISSDTANPFMPASDGRTVMMPAVVSLFDNSEDNFGFYKLSLFHQLGYAEFGLFKQIKRVNEVLASFDDRLLAERLFMIVEDGRIDWRLCARYPGLAPQASVQKHRAAQARQSTPLTPRGRMLEALVLLSLDVGLGDARLPALTPSPAALLGIIEPLTREDASVMDSLAVATRLYQLVSETSASARKQPDTADLLLMLEELPEPIAYRGEMDVDKVESTLKIDALVEEWQEQLEAPAEDNAMLSSGANDEQIDIGDLKKGDVSSGVSMIIEQLEQELGLESGSLDPEAPGIPANLPGGVGNSQRDASRHVYDEWDFEIGDYRSRWCTLFEHRDLDRDDAYVQRVLREHSDLSKRIRQQLNRVKPEMLRKVKGVVEGEELDLERSIAYLVDRKAGLLPDDNIYVQRQRKDRDVSTLFLLDMSASTDDIVPDPDNPPVEYPEVDDDEFLVEFFRQQKEQQDNSRKIIDLEKESVLLMADALQTLGDAYSVCGFSGYGKDQVDYYLCKDFNEPFNERSRSRIGGIKPCRSTRMGPPIRHGTKRLIETGSRIKAMIIISDGYPQDHDYGTDRNSRDYGLMDTMKALTEAKQQGVLTYCLTVDPSGHDYLRAMCPDSQYMVIQDIVQLPHELSRVYRSLTG